MIGHALDKYELEKIWQEYIQWNEEYYSDFWTYGLFSWNELTEVYTAPDTPWPPKRKTTRQARGNYPKPTQNFLVCSRGVSNDKSPGRWERKWVKNQFSIEIFVCKFENFLKKFKS